MRTTAKLFLSAAAIGCFALTLATVHGQSTFVSAGETRYELILDSSNLGVWTDDYGLSYFSLSGTTPRSGSPFATDDDYCYVYAKEEDVFTKGEKDGPMIFALECNAYCYFDVGCHIKAGTDVEAYALLSTDRSGQMKDVYEPLVAPTEEEDDLYYLFYLLELGEKVTFKGIKITYHC